MEAKVVETTEVSDNSCPGLHFFSSNWKLWFHLPNDDDWSMKSYKLIDNISTIEQSISVLEQIDDNVIKFCMLFLMKDGIAPRWEDPKNKNGGYFSYKVSNKNVKETWRDLSFLLMGNSISKDKNFMNEITGISISPKKNFCIIKIWLSSGKFQNPRLVTPEIKHLSPMGCLFKKYN